MGSVHGLESDQFDVSRFFSFIKSCLKMGSKSYHSFWKFFSPASKFTSVLSLADWQLSIILSDTKASSFTQISARVTIVKCVGDKLDLKNGQNLLNYSKIIRRIEELNESFSWAMPRGFHLN